MKHIQRIRKYKLNPVTKSLIILGLFLCWIFASSFFSTEEQTQNAHKDRSLLSLEETKVTEPRQLDEIANVDPTSETEHVTVLDIVNEPKRNCLQPAIEQFPEPSIDKKARQKGAVIIHIFIAFYMFIGLAIICEDYFVPALTRTSDALNVPPDVAGATFMAAGSSAPELATSVIGVFVAEDDIGVSGVVGSAVFNITLVIAVCALSATHAITLNWYSVCRDCFSYLVCIIILICTIADQTITWPEASFFLVTYVLYCVAMAFNSTLESCAMALPVPDSWRIAGGDKDLGLDEEGAAKEKEKETHITADGTTEIKITPQVEEKEFKMEEFKDPLKKPLALDDGRWAVFCWYVMLPLTIVSVFTVPNCRNPKWSKWFALSFLCSVFWICIYSYVMVWMITIIGFTFGIPDTVMGLTFIAAGVSVPDALSGVAVVKEGHGDMAVSNAIGSNVFDILMCLGIPWFLKTVIVKPGSEVKVIHKGILYSTFTLFSTVVFLILASHANGWKMDRKYGVILLVWYFIVMAFASLYETNLLGNFNPTECDSKY